jgi:hypothetical protein
MKVTTAFFNDMIVDLMSRVKSCDYHALYETKKDVIICEEALSLLPNNVSDSETIEIDMLLHEKISILFYKYGYEKTFYGVTFLELPNREECKKSSNEDKEVWLRAWNSSHISGHSAAESAKNADSCLILFNERFSKWT